MVVLKRIGRNVTAAHWHGEVFRLARLATNISCVYRSSTGLTKQGVRKGI